MLRREFGFSPAEMPPPTPGLWIRSHRPVLIGLSWCRLRTFKACKFEWKKKHIFYQVFPSWTHQGFNEGEDWNLCQNWKTAPSANIDHFAPSSTQFYCNIHFDLSHFCVYCQWVHQHQFQKFWGNNKLEPTTRSWHWGLKQDDKMGTDIIWKNGNQFNVKELGTRGVKFWLFSRKG